MTELKTLCHHPTLYVRSFIIHISSAPANPHGFVSVPTCQPKGRCKIIFAVHNQDLSLVQRARARASVRKATVALARERVLRGACFSDTREAGPAVVARRRGRVYPVRAQPQLLPQLPIGLSI
jgi:hypothetical protein